MADARTRSLSTLGTSQVLDLSQDIQVLHTINISMINYLATKFFGSDLTRIVYASNAYAFRRRVEQKGKETQGLALPFANIKLVNVQPSTQRPWKNMTLEAEGAPSYEIANKLRMTPVTMTYESTMFFSTELESLFSMSTALWDAAMETKILSSADISYQPDVLEPAVIFSFDNIGVLHSDGLGYNQEFMESDWLQKNKIRAIPLNYTLETWLWKTPIGVPSPTIAVSKKIILEMYQNNDLNFVDNLVASVEYIG
jgi:hypothetical protein